MNLPGRITLLACAVLGLVASAVAQDHTALYGRVASSDLGGDVPAGWVVRVTARREGTNETLAQRDSSRELYCVIVPANAQVRLYFETSLGYRSSRSPVVDTSRSDRRDAYRMLPDITLTRTLRRTGNNARAQAQQDLNADIDIARETGSLDILQAKVTGYRAVYSNDAEVLMDIDRTAANIPNTPQFQRLATPEYEQRLELLRGLEAWRQGRLTKFDPDQLLALAQDKTVFQSIRSEATLALAAQFAADPAKQSEVLKFFRAQISSTSSDLLLPAMIGLANTGTAADKEAIAKSVSSDDSERAVSAIVAIGEAKLKEGTAALADLLRKDSNLMLEQLATKSLASLAQARDRSAIVALSEAVKNDSEPTVRVGAAEALGTVISIEPGTRQILKDVQLKDASKGVRTAAAVSLERGKQ